MYSEEKANQMYWLTVRTMEEIVRGGTWALVLNRRVERHDYSGVWGAEEQQSRIPCWTCLIWNVE